MQKATWSPGCTPAARSRWARAVGRGVELGERHHRARACHDVRGFVGLGRHEGSGEHVLGRYRELPSRDGSRGGPVRPARALRARWSPAIQQPSGSTMPALAMAAVLRARPTDGAADLLDELAAGCTDRSLDGLRDHIYDELGFAGDAEQYDDPRNSFLDVVLERRRGLPDPPGDGRDRGRAALRRPVRRASGCRCTSWSAPLTTTMPSSIPSRVRHSIACRRPPPVRDALGRAAAVGRPPPGTHAGPPHRVAHAARTCGRPMSAAPIASGWPWSPACVAAIPELGAGASAEAVRLGAVFN